MNGKIQIEEMMPLVPTSPHPARLPKLSLIPVDISEILDTKTSRFEEDFTVLSILGVGAFGRVLKVKNVLDSKTYALKIVRTPSKGGEALLKTLREVKLMADIEHPNIVRYYSSWFQFTNSTLDLDADSKNAEDLESKDYSQSIDPSSSTPPSVIPISLHSIPKSPEAAKSPNSVPQRPLSLFIQMELCDSTLQEWIKDLNVETTSYRKIEEKILHCFVDLLKGVQCIHMKGYIHRDIKPSNIYWKSTGVTSSSFSNLGGKGGDWKIGDLGLATWINSSIDGLSEDEKQSFGIGTTSYGSPEQLNEDFTAHYSFCTDVYSLGIILFELLVPFGSGMERAEVLSLLRKEILPEDFLIACPKEV